MINEEYRVSGTPFAKRSNNYENMSIDKKIDINEQLTQDISQIMVIAENYPDLKSSQNFIELSRELTKVEDEIANSRKYYNGTVRILNDKIQMFPNNLVAKIFKFKEFKMFEADTNEKNNIDSSFRNDCSFFVDWLLICCNRG